MDENENDEFVTTTAEDFELFTAECRRWIEIYGLKHYKVYFRHEDIDDSLGQCTTKLDNRIAAITFAKKWSKEDYSESNIRQTAFHEVTELLVSPICGLANHRYASESEIDRELHAVIRTLENVLYPKYSE